jgi:hypothetical protein
MNFIGMLQQIRHSRLEHCDVRHGEGQVWLGCSRKAENMSQGEPCTISSSHLRCSSQNKQHGQVGCCGKSVPGRMMRQVLSEM